MRYQGKIAEWNEARGFGFIMWNGGNDKVFVHISAFQGSRRRPVTGDVVTYEVTKDETGRHRAEKVAFAGALPARTTTSPGSAAFVWRFAGVIMIAAAGVGVFQHYKAREHFSASAFSDRLPEPEESNFSCSGKTHCSQMTSCQEATFYLKNCPGTEIDGDRDGVPCESQWCN